MSFDEETLIVLWVLLGIENEMIHDWLFCNQVNDIYTYPRWSIDLSGDLDIWPETGWPEIRSRDHQSSYQEDPRCLWSWSLTSRWNFHKDNRDPVPFVGFFLTRTLPDVLVCVRIPVTTSVLLHYPYCVSGLGPSCSFHIESTTPRSCHQFVLTTRSGFLNLL